MNHFSLPAEWAEQDAVMLTWPHGETDWADCLTDVEPVYVELACTILRFQGLVVVAHNEALKAHIQQLLKEAKANMAQLHVVVAPSDDTWARDHGPITLQDQYGQVRVLDFTFNGWGNKFVAKHDDAINLAVCRSLTVPYQKVELVLEGGAIESDGEGTLLTTKSCLLNSNRNPSLEQAALTEQLLSLLGMERILWLSQGHLEGDDTDSHIDTLARFAPNNTILYVRCDDENDPHFNALWSMERELQQFKTQHDTSYRLLPLPWPEAKYNEHGKRLPATYANFLVINDAVLVPMYNDYNDSIALGQLRKAFPERDVIGIHCLPLIKQFGSLHCITMQLPRGFLANSEQPEDLTPTDSANTSTP